MIYAFYSKNRTFDCYQSIVAFPCLCLGPNRLRQSIPRVVWIFYSRAARECPFLREYQARIACTRPRAPGRAEQHHLARHSRSCIGRPYARCQLGSVDQFPELLLLSMAIQRHQYTGSDITDFHSDLRVSGRHAHGPRYRGKRSRFDHCSKPLDFARCDPYAAISEHPMDS